MAEWSSFVNQDFYGQDSGYKKNTEEVEFKSGRTISYLKNTTPKKTHTINIRCKDKGTQKIDGKTEFEHFLDWFENTIKSGTIPFNLKDLTTGKEIKMYRLAEHPTWKGQKYKEINLKIEEV
ncbi:hypothetical protein [Treponema pectinovorum]|uniref:hypothetical protein n=1 Tax=Treponema pectinovorum TaxID=164 RepID=UPI0011C788BB|nr:hypothetical protein [Treponema pectinovorum]